MTVPVSGKGGKKEDEKNREKNSNDLTEWMASSLWYAAVGKIRK